MTRVTLGDVILRRVPLTAREAVTLILAVARVWDRQRPVSASPMLPAIDAIQLHETGAVSFLVTPGTSSGQSDTRSETLSSLLGRLLGTDEAEALNPRTVLASAPRSGAPDVPAVPDESFRSVLMRFADDDYAGTVASVFARTVKAGQEPSLEVAPARPRHVGPERRRQPRIVAELRLDIRQLERELFALRASSTPPPPPRVPARQRTIMRVAFAGAAACVLALLTFIAIDRNPVRAGSEAAGGLSGSRATDSATTSAPSVARADSSVVEGTEFSSIRKDRPSTRAPRAQARRQVTRTTPQSQKRPAATFAGGARSIDWLRH